MALTTTDTSPLTTLIRLGGVDAGVSFALGVETDDDGVEAIAGDVTSGRSVGSATRPESGLTA
jgi:hypothetical protein